MAGVSNFSTIGALSNPQEGTADTEAQQTPAGVPSAVPGGGRLQSGANAAFAFGDIYKQYKKAQLDEVNESTQLARASRDRLTQIWQAGQANPALQNNPQIHKQIQQYWKNVMGADFPVTPGQSFDWSMLAPPKSLEELSGPMLEQLRQMPPLQRRAFAKASNIIDANDAFLDAPATLSQTGINRVMTDYTNMMSKASSGKMDPAVLKQWVDTSRDQIDYVYGEGKANSILQDNELFGPMQTQMLAQLDKLNADTAKLKGLDPHTQAEIALDRQRIIDAKDVDGLTGLKRQVLGVQLRDMPGIDAAKIRQMNATADQDNAIASHWGEVVTEMKTSGGNPYTAAGQVNEQLKQANADLAIAANAYKTALNSPEGVPDDIHSAWVSAQQRVDDLTAAQKQFTDPKVLSAIKAAQANRNNPQLNSRPTDGSGPNIPPGAIRSPDGKQYAVKNGVHGTVYDASSGKVISTW